MLFQDVGEQFGRLSLLVRQLRIRVQETADGKQIRSQSIHLGLHLPLEMLHFAFACHREPPFCRTAEDAILVSAAETGSLPGVARQGNRRKTLSGRYHAAAPGDKRRAWILSFT
jgi:hypothetical protein